MINDLQGIFSEEQSNFRDQLMIEQDRRLDQVSSEMQ